LRQRICKLNLGGSALRSARFSETRDSERAFKQLTESKLLCPMFKEFEIEVLLTLSFQDSDDVLPLAIGNLVAQSIPVELGENDVFRRTY